MLLTRVTWSYSAFTFLWYLVPTYNVYLQCNTTNTGPEDRRTGDPRTYSHKPDPFCRAFLVHNSMHCGTAAWLVRLPRIVRPKNKLQPKKVTNTGLKSSPRVIEWYAHRLGYLHFTSRYGFPKSNGTVPTFHSKIQWKGWYCAVSFNNSSQ